MSYMTPNKARFIVERDEEKALKAFDPYDVLTGNYKFNEYLEAINYLAKVEYAREQIQRNKKMLLNQYRRVK